MKNFGWLTIPLALIGGIISRFHGGGFKGGVNKSFKNILWASPFALCTAFMVLPYTSNLVTALLTATALGIAVLI